VVEPGFLSSLRVAPGSRVSLAGIDPGGTHGWDKDSAGERLKHNIERLFDLQSLLYADGRHALLVIFQAMDAGGKDGVIRNVMRGLNPQGCRVIPFKAPTARELSYDFLWRIHRAVPPKGDIGIFNRSHYEDVLIVRVKNLVPEEIWRPRYEQINDFERLLAASGTKVLKFFLHISKQEQKTRLEKRLQDATKHWKAAPEDLIERQYWDEYLQAYDEALSRCSTEHAPWYTIPADRKWFRNLAVSEAMVEALEAMALRYPKPKFDVASVEVK